MNIIYNESLAENYNNYHKLSDNFFKNQIDTIVNLLDIKPNSLVLDVGCGSGRLLSPISKFCNRIVGVEYSENMYLNCLKNKPENADIFNIDFLKFETNQKFDSIYFSMSLHQIASCYGYKKVLKKAVSLLKENGRLLIITIDPKQFKEIFINNLSDKITEIDKKRFLKFSKLKKYFDELNLVVDFKMEQTIYSPIDKNTFIDMLRNKYISTLQLIPEEELSNMIKIVEGMNEKLIIPDCYQYILLHRG